MLDVIAAGKIVDRFLRRPDERIRAGDYRLDADALALIDTNGDGQAERLELTAALLQGTIKESGHKLIAAEELRLPRPPVITADDYGLRGRPWMEDAFVPSEKNGLRRATPTSVPGGHRDEAAPIPQEPQTGAYSYARGGLAFGDVATNVKTPEAVAAFLKGSDGSVVQGRNISYDFERRDNSNSLRGYLGGFSSQEVLAAGRGICRDTHALARDILRANGYDAELLGILATNQIHAVTAYKDPQTGYWGIIEYGTIYPANQLKAHTAEEALLKFRPDTLAIAHFEDNGPRQRSPIDGLIYMPASRVFERFLAGPSLQAHNSVMGTNTGATITADLSRDGTWQAAAQVIYDPRFPYLEGAVMLGAWKTFRDAGVRVGAGAGIVPSNMEHAVGTNESNKHLTYMGFLAAEEYHPDFLFWKDIAGSGLKIGLTSHTQLQLLLAADRWGIDSGTSLGLCNLKWNPDVTVERKFALWNPDNPDTRCFVAYGVGLDAGLLASHYSSGGKSFPLNQYVTGGIQTQPTSWMGISVLGFVPITNHTNDFAAAPLGRVELSFPYVKVGTTQGLDTGRYDVSGGVQVGPVTIGVFAGVEHDRRTGRATPVAGGQCSFTW